MYQLRRLNMFKKYTIIALGTLIIGNYTNGASYFRRFSVPTAATVTASVMGTTKAICGTETVEDLSPLYRNSLDYSKATRTVLGALIISKQSPKHSLDWQETILKGGNSCKTSCKYTNERQDGNVRVKARFTLYNDSSEERVLVASHAKLRLTGRDSELEGKNFLAKHGSRFKVEDVYTTCHVTVGKTRRDYLLRNEVNLRAECKSNFSTSFLSWILENPEAPYRASVPFWP